MKPSSFRIRAMSALMREAGIATESCRACWALRIRVSMSAIGSVIDIRSVPLLPARLHDARELAGQGQPAEADPAEAELAYEGARAPAQVAAAVRLHLELGRPFGLDDLRDLGHVFSPNSGMASPLAGEAAAPLRRCARWSRWSPAGRVACRCCRSRSRERPAARVGRCCSCRAHRKSWARRPGSRAPGAARC